MSEPLPKPRPRAPDLETWPLEEPECANPYTPAGATAGAGERHGLSDLWPLRELFAYIPRRDKDEWS